MHSSESTPTTPTTPLGSTTPMTPMPEDHTPTAQGTLRQAPGKGPRTSPIVWGCLVLLFCAFIAQHTFAPGSVPSEFWLIGSFLGLGALLLGVGIAIVVRNVRTTQR